MNLEEIRKFLRERGLEAVPVTAPATGTLADFLSWTPANTASVTFSGGDFPLGITEINASGCTASTVRFTDAFSACVNVFLDNSNVTTLVIPATTTTLVLDASYALTPLDCTFPGGLQHLSLNSALYSSIPDLPAGLLTLNAGNCGNLGGLPTLPGTLTELYVDSTSFSELPALDATQLVILQAIACALTTLPPLPATLTYLYINGSVSLDVPTIPAACIDINAADCGWDSAKLDNLLAQLVANARHNGALIADGGNDVPSAAGLADSATLVSRGWIVSTN